jgi:hypothetical protein
MNAPEGAGFSAWDFVENDETMAKRELAGL